MTWYTENGWPACGPGDLDRSPIPGTDIVVPLQRGIPNTILKAFMADLNQFVESAYNSRGGADEGGWTGTNSVPTSNHLGGSAVDYNWSDHPMGVALAGWDGSSIIKGSQEPAVRELLRFYTYKDVQLVWWGNDWNSPKDSMHFQMGYGTFTAQDVCLEFIAKFIRPDGFSTYKRTLDRPQIPASPTPPKVSAAALDVLMRAMAPTGVTRARMAQLLPGIARAYDLIDADTVLRRSVFNAETGHESGGMKYTEEIASGEAYEWRTDLGNTRAGDGVRYKGRDVIQVTGRHNYAELSSWAHANGIVDSPTFFIDHPELLATDKFIFVGAVWYWTTQRPLNDAADAGDIERATRYVNGGLNGIDDRRSRYGNNLALGDQLMLIQAEPTERTIEEELMADQTGYPSRSIYKTPGETTTYKLSDFIANLDAFAHREAVEADARLGGADSLVRIATVAAGLGDSETARSSWAKAHATAVLLQVQAVNPAAVEAAIAQVERTITT